MSKTPLAAVVPLSGNLLEVERFFVAVASNGGHFRILHPSEVFVGSYFFAILFCTAYSMYGLSLQFAGVNV